jgi:hypothetical protein
MNDYKLPSGAACITAVEESLLQNTVNSNRIAELERMLTSVESCMSTFGDVQGGSPMHREIKRLLAKQ